MKKFLEEVMHYKKAELLSREEERPLKSFAENIEKASGGFLKALAGDGLKIIAEIKPRSPALGKLAEGTQINEKLAVYARYAQAVSVLTDRRFFDGSIDLLRQVSRQIMQPTLLKDFVISHYQIYEAREAGAEAVLLIVKIVPERLLTELYRLCLDLGMTAVVEVQNEDELARALQLNPELVLINNRNLDNLEIDLNTTKRLAPQIPESTLFISASGIDGSDDMRQLRPYTSRFLIGSAFMNASNPRAKFEEFLNLEKQFVNSRKEKE